jgi:hypothetical protein
MAKKQSTDGELFTRPWTKHHSLITNPAVVTVTAIKKKFVAQLPMIKYANLWDEGRYSIMGRLADGRSVILKETGGTGNLYEVADLDYRQYLLNLYRREMEDKLGKRLGADPEDKVHHDAVHERMLAAMENMPQLFEE